MRRALLAVATMGLTACGGDEVGTSVGPTLASSSEESSGSTSTGLPTSGPVLPTSTGEAATSPSSTSEAVSESSSDDRGESSSSSEPLEPATGPSEPDTGSETSEQTATTEPPASCADGLKNQDESDVDCGGSCGPCGLDASCEGDGDCASGWCDAGKCGEPGCTVDGDCDEFAAPCAEATCNTASKECEVVAIADGAPCEDGDLCTSGEVCAAGACVDGTAPDCSGLTNVCGVGQCDAQTGACVASPIPEMDGKACDDGFVCTPNDTCQSGTCGVGGPGFLWFEDFSDPDPTWTLGESWQIGAAAPSPAGMNGMDPATDHTPNGDERLAGTRIGELMPADALAKTCLTTPLVDASGASTLWLSFWRHLHTDYFPFAVHTIEAWDGADWQTLQTGFISPGVNDLEWKLVSYDLSQFNHSTLQARVCVRQIGSAMAAGGWSIDDVTIGPHVCTPNG